MCAKYEQSEKLSKDMPFESYSLFDCVQNHYSDPSLWDEVKQLHRRSGKL